MTLKGDTSDQNTHFHLPLKVSDLTFVTLIWRFAPLITVSSPQICFFFVSHLWIKKSLVAKKKPPKRRQLKWSLSYMLQTPSSPPTLLCLSFPMLSPLFLPSILICVAFANLDVPLVGPQGSKSAFDSRETERRWGTQRPFIHSHPVCVGCVCCISVFLKTTCP